MGSVTTQDIYLDQRTSNDPLGLTLDGQYRIGGFKRDDNYAKVYEVTCNSTSAQLEARFYCCNEISERGRRYQQGNKRRLMSRSVFETKWREHIIMVYKTDVMSAMEALNSGEPMESTKPAAIVDKEHLVSMAHITPKTVHKSEHRLEAERRRQYQKGMLIRRKQCVAKETVNPDACFTDLAEFTTFLHLSYFSSLAIREAHPDPAEETTRKCLRTRDLKFRDAEDMEQYLKAKQRGITFLNALHIQEISKSEPVASAKHNVDVAANVDATLPKIIDESQTSYNALNERLLRVQELQAQIKEERGLRAKGEQTGLSTESNRGGTQTDSVWSKLYVQIHHHLGYGQSPAAEEELSRYQAQAESAPLPRVFALREEYESLLKFTDKGWSHPS
ncbi:hypothetical protein DL766_008382 [Monosporascus sp. MC13-8B]|uniref:Uncharacterized protein n=1 Tax=Monosporascus cannonballus TaxID=155416 RepID=A0ABY0H8C6_9PEZI|nr:hypothetical protein DL762_004247 [Monosporascus cannonballus]RYP00635.1 hypothetical protein DL763_000689 [Monosporascus cannonballus]RYP19704.1 hypothetical protein DL766_008382 [Monosporascus sp. MC13-8B]